MANLIQSDLVSKEQVAAFYGVSFQTINRYIAKGVLKPVKVGKFVKFKQSELPETLEHVKRDKVTVKQKNEAAKEALDGLLKQTGAKTVKEAIQVLREMGVIK